LELDSNGNVVDVHPKHWCRWLTRILICSFINMA
jgi:hypothetical protein